MAPPHEFFWDDNLTYLSNGYKGLKQDTDVFCGKKKAPKLPDFEDFFLNSPSLDNGFQQVTKIKYRRIQDT